MLYSVHNIQNTGENINLYITHRNKQEKCAEPILRRYLHIYIYLKI